MSGLFDRLQDEIDSREEQTGISPVDLLDLPPNISAIIQKIIRRNGLRLDDIAAELDQEPAEVEETLEKLVAKGYLRRVEVQQVIWYKAHFRRKPDKLRSSSVWKALNETLDEENKSQQ